MNMEQWNSVGYCAAPRRLHSLPGTVRPELHTFKICLISSLLTMSFQDPVAQPLDQLGFSCVSELGGNPESLVVPNRAP